jgi:hypothetical protein
MNKYSQLNNDELESHFSSFLIDSWSYSRVAQFARNEKEFERTAIYREENRVGASTISGNAYHKALEYYFSSLKNNEQPLTLPELERIAFDYIDNIPARLWKLGKTTPTVESAITTATKNATALLANFYQEKDIYEKDIKEIIYIETPFCEWVTVNGVDIPLPCHAKIDLVFLNHNDDIIIVDHKSKTSFTSDDEKALSFGKQGITYYKVLESKGIIPAEVWFIENKISHNKDNTPQLRCHKIAFDLDTVRLYEVLLYEPLKRMIEAVANPDYVYCINDNDNFCDRAVLYDFWARTQIAEIDDFNINPKKRDLLAKRQRKIRDASMASVNPKVITTFRKEAASFINYDLNATNMSNSEKIEHALRTFGMNVQVVHLFEGYSSDTYLLEPGAGVKISNIMRYKMDIANALNVNAVTISDNLHIHDGRAYIKLDAPKQSGKILNFSASLVEGRKIPIGRDNFNNLIVWDLNNQATPHVLVCGATGSGKSVSLRSTIEAAKVAGVRNIIVFDPKYEFTNVDGIEVYNDIDDIETKLGCLVLDMQAAAKHNYKADTLIIFDEFADAVQSARSGKDLDIRKDVVVGMYANGKPKIENRIVGQDKSLEENLKILLQKGRSLGYRIMAATQRASVQVITGDAKVNFPVQICFRVPKALDSKVVLDEDGAETLAGAGDGLMRSPEYQNQLIRFQGFYYG